MSPVYTKIVYFKTQLALVIFLCFICYIIQLNCYLIVKYTLYNIILKLKPYTQPYFRYLNYLCVIYICNLFRLYLTNVLEQSYLN